MIGALFHVLVILCFGWAVLRGLRAADPNPSERNEDRSEDRAGDRIGSWAESFLIGFPVSTQITASLLILGVSLGTCAIIMPALALLALGATGFIRPFKFEFSLPRLTWYEIGLGLFVMVKIGLGLYFLLETPLIFDDAMTAWAGRGRALYGGVNWSFLKGAAHFLGSPGPTDYPLAKVVFYALSGVWNNGFDGVLVRFDTLIFHLCTAGILWSAVGRLNTPRFFRSAAAFAVLAPSFNFIHALSGYGDILVQAFGTAALAAMLKRNSFTAGLFAAGVILSKNDGLILMVPGLAACFLIMQIRHGAGFETGTSALLRFAAGLGLCAPWLVYRQLTIFGPMPGTASMALAWGIVLALLALPVLDARLPKTRPMNILRLVPPIAGGIGLAAGLAALAFKRLDIVGFEVHAGAPLKLASLLFNTQTHSIIWLFAVLALLAGAKQLLQAPEGRGVAVLMAYNIAAMTFLFTFTGAYEWMTSETTVNRVLLQFYGVALLGAFMSLALQAEAAGNTAPPAPAAAE